MLSTIGWSDYELLDSGDSKRIERFGNYTICRPDPQAIWKTNQKKWAYDSKYEENKGWDKKFNNDWILNYKNIKLRAKQTQFKHTGIFPEQVINWEFIENKIASQEKQPNVLNLFGYTGAATLLCASNGAKVTHLDGSKPSINWAKENQELSGLKDKPIRWILDDALEFTARESRRGNLYDAVIMDPPVYGHGPNGQIWNFNKSFPELLSNIKKIMSKNPIFFIVNAYAISSSSVMLKNMLEDYLGFESKKIEYGELAIKEKQRDRLLSTGLFARWPS
ncbi:MAG: hypothetical protein A3B38_01505 [Candidatus Levybacteria bacterium RIFCSPLOWO2_01_FULL_36_13]|nr:MAG: hypothetical protein A2684_02740 [Candidatus Levybacteria bacterium RIFCSPHIGHO2_01_FULL_36_15b]OGH35691.1 MAG: hypothetical protein A3B38_01505 [Candidatus Levybacteria bacterium RIFCSPLOWO2_01_FULL_36_13]